MIRAMFLGIICPSLSGVIGNTNDGPSQAMARNAALGHHRFLLVGMWPCLVVGSVFRVVEPVVLELPGGVRIHITVEGAKGQAKRGRKPSPATQALTAALWADKAAGHVRNRAAYKQILKKAGHRGSSASANIILARETKRILGSTPRTSSRRPTRRSAAGRKPSPATAALRERLAADQSKGGLHDVNHYTRWLVDHAKIGLKKARPIVYRELRAAR